MGTQQDTTTSLGAPYHQMASKLKAQSQRILQLESALANAFPSADTTATYHLQAPVVPPTPVSVRALQTSVTINDQETMLLRGKGFATQFSGTTHPLALIAQTPELNLFTKEALERYPSFQRMKQEMGDLELRIKCADKRCASIEDTCIYTLLPPKEQVDQAVQAYFGSYGRIYHIIHAPSFEDAYRDMWQVGLPQARTGTIILVLLMVACVSCLSPAKPWTYIGNSSKARETAITITQICESWINRQSQKRVTAVYFQLRFLLCLTKQTTARKYKRTWTEAGNLLRFCMSAGLHRDPDSIRKPTTAMDKELRRRIWAAVVDLELQASFDRGMVSTPVLSQSDSPRPSNIHDEDISFEQMPRSMPSQDFTSSWYLSLVNSSAVLKSTLNTVLNDIRHAISFEEVKQYTDEIERHLQLIPECNDPAAEESRSFLILKLLQYQLAIHNRFLRAASTNAERQFSITVALDTANQIIEIHRSLTSKDKHTLQLFGHDLVRATLTIANIVSIQSTSSMGLLTCMAFQHIPLIEQAIEMLKDKAARLGCEQRQLWVALAANGFVKAKQDPERRDKHMQTAVDIVTRVYHDLMSCQQSSMPAEKTLSISHQPSAPANLGIVEYLPTVSGEPEATSSLATANDPPLYDFDDFAAWTFEDWMLDSTDIVVDFGTA